MYPVRLSFDEVVGRIEALLGNGHDAEALVTSMFTFEKLMKRSLRRAVVARGFSIEQAEKLLKRDGFDALLAKWEIFERTHRTLPEILGPDWQPVMEAKKMRNDLVHGNRVFDLVECRQKANEVLNALKKFHEFLIVDYGVDPWHKQPHQRAQLQWEA